MTDEGCFLVGKLIVVENINNDRGYCGGYSYYYSPETDRWVIGGKWRGT